MSEATPFGETRSLSGRAWPERPGPQDQEREACDHPADVTGACLDDSETGEEALLEGDIVLVRGTARAALRNRDFRIVWTGVFLSSIGTWMQNVLLGAYGWELTHSASFVGTLYIAQLGPLLLLSPVGGLIADLVDRRRYLVSMQLLQLCGSLGLAALVISDAPSETGLIACVFTIGICNALGAPGQGAILPSLVPREDLAGAIALTSVQINLSRVIGPAIGAALYTRAGASAVFAVNAGTYLFAVAGLLIARYPRRVGAVVAEKGFARLASGFRIARSDPLISRVLLTLVSFSLFSLSFVGLMPVIAATNFGIRPKSVEYGLLYAVFGFGAAAGAVSVGTFFAHRAKARLLRPGFAAFAVLLAGFAVARSAAVAYPLVMAVGYSYFLVITSLSTVLQEHLTDAVRGRVVALWIMAFGGTVPIGVWAGGRLVGMTSITAVLIGGAAWAGVLAVLAEPERLTAPALALAEAPVPATA